MRRTKEEWEELDRELAGLYEKAGPRAKLSDQDWLRVDALLGEYSRASVRKSCQRYRIPEHTTGELAEDVRVKLVQKFIERRFDGADSVSMVIRVAAIRDVISRLRRVKSPRACGIGERDPVARSLSDVVTGDLFLVVRGRLEEFRLQGMGLARDAILAARLLSGQYPDPMFLRGIVPERLRRVCHTASVFSINRALQELAGDRHR